MQRNRVAVMAAVLGIVGAVACGGGTEPNPDTKKPLVDPFAVVLIENTMTAASGSKARYYDIDFALTDTSVDGHLSNHGSVGPGERVCGSLSGFVGLRTMQIIALTDTTTAEMAATKPRATLDSAALGRTTWTGLYRMTTIVFDPLVSADTSRGHTPQRPVKWRWTISDGGNTLVEDSTTVCVY